MGLAAVAAGASGLIVEVHPEPERALSDGYQSLHPNQFGEIAAECRAIHDLLAARRGMLWKSSRFRLRCRIRARSILFTQGVPGRFRRNEANFL